MYCNPLNDKFILQFDLTLNDFFVSNLEGNSLYCMVFKLMPVKCYYMYIILLFDVFISI